MAVDFEYAPVKDFDQWYALRTEDSRDGTLRNFNLAECASKVVERYTHFKREMDSRCENYYKLELLADGQVITEKADLPNVSSGETAGLVRRMARNLVQHTPNVEVISKFDDESAPGILAAHILRSKIIGDDQYSNDMQQNLFASTKTALTLGFDAVVPCLEQTATGEWYVKYDTIHYRDVFPEPGVKDVKDATEVFVRRYLTRGQIVQLIRDNVACWDHVALKTLLKSQSRPPVREAQSVSLQDRQRKVIAEGYEIVTWYSSSGAPFLTFSPTTKMLFRIEKNKDPLRRHPVFFLVLEKDAQQPLGKSQVELVLGRQEFQDLMHNGAMKLWYRNINPSIIGYGTINSVPNLSPGKYTPISNPNAKLEAFEVNTQTLMQYTSIAQANLGSMVNLVGSADQQMATQAGNGMSATPQGVEAQQAMVDITTNNYQKAIESFFSRYCSYALTIYFQELRGVQGMTPSADARRKLVDAKLPKESFDKDGNIKISFEGMATEYFVRCVPGSLVEMEDEKQLRILNQMFIPLSQAMPALASMQDPEVLRRAAQAMQYIIEKQIELSGSSNSHTLKTIFTQGRTPEVESEESRTMGLEDGINGALEVSIAGTEQTALAITSMQQQMSLMSQTLTEALSKLGMGVDISTSEPNSSQQTSVSGMQAPDMVGSARA